ncbi:hypothetical protein [Niallia taxi]|uniref:hypothetical protein n=1 Tax=Niallia taxi TaxID=2499688 RepID=UPI0015F578DA|nr:hypothetical protein [Niallia taxi]
MTGKNKNLLELLDELDFLLNEYDDNPNNAIYFSRYLRLFLASAPKNGTLPTVEVMTMIKYLKPNIYRYMKKHSSTNPVIDLLGGLELDLEQTKTRLDEIKAEQSTE